MGRRRIQGLIEFSHQACSKHRVKKNGFEEMKYAALAALESCVMSGNGFCETTYEAIHVVGQCAGSLRACDCGACVDSAARIAEDECRIFSFWRNIFGWLLCQL
ncbi:UNVERIFIED_CONTAM: hypothetical protein Sradi_6520000 [Sesamum radiatum]|uniref:Gnk2-homologous domain-containing protein n=1 Tax=Sesamum radiatum TaxID=300843 RepID=A0AAW2JW46_SESRA